MKRITVGSLVARLAIGIALAITLFPMYWMIITSFKRRVDLFKVPPDWIPKVPILTHYQNLVRGGLGQANFLTYFRNSVIVCLAVVALTLILAIPAAYVFSRVRFGGRRTLITGVLISQMFPIVMLLIPLYIMFMKVRLVNTHLSVIFTYLVFTLPFSMWMLKGYFDTIPKELEDAAMIDGCSRLGSMWRVALPSIKPGIIATTMVAFIMGWDEFIIALTLLTADNMRTLPPGIAVFYVGEFQIRWGDMMAASVVTALPILLAFGFLHKHLIGGLTVGAVKG